MAAFNLVFGEFDLVCVAAVGRDGLGGGVDVRVVKPQRDACVFIGRGDGRVVNLRRVCLHRCQQRGGSIYVRVG